MRKAVFLIICLLLPGCTTINNRSFDFTSIKETQALEKCDSSYTDNYLTNHAIFVDHNGKPLQYKDGDFEGRYDFATHLDRMFKNLDMFYKQNKQKGASTTKVMIFIHGGLNGPEAGLERSRNLTCNIFNPADATSNYPIFVNWDSGALSSLTDHLFFVRQGEVRKVTGPLTFPVIAVEDLGRSIVGAPSSWYNQYFETDLRSLIFPAQPYDNTCPEEYRTMANGEVNAINALYCAEKTLSKKERVSISLDGSAERWTQGKIWGKAFTYLLTAPSSKLVLTPFIAGLGRPAWDIMVRRTTSVFTPPNQFDIRHQLSKKDPVANRHYADEANLFKRNGAVGKLMERLKSFSEGHPDLEITLTGHSMGTIVISNLLRDTDIMEHVNVKNIVYMAAACSIRDFQSSVIPFLQADKNRDTRFFNLTLHPINDADELNWSYLDLIPRGSLLEWIDNFYTTPETHLDRTMGKWTNVVQAMNIIPDGVRDRVTIKGFGLGKIEEFGPQMHGEFDDFSPDLKWKFWDEKFWTADQYYH